MAGVRCKGRQCCSTPSILKTAPEVDRGCTEDVQGSQRSYRGHAESICPTGIVDNIDQHEGLFVFKHFDIEIL